MELDRNQLKILALRERISQIVTEYEDKDADRRVEITENMTRIQELEQRVAELENKDEDVSKDEDSNEAS